ncbi:unnamed protein product [Peniophora sp. CBMAI 1063]|nr:unnamed protein product [Peniophora sp. CBMAI 1063]
MPSHYHEQSLESTSTSASGVGHRGEHNPAMSSTATSSKSDSPRSTLLTGPSSSSPRSHKLLPYQPSSSVSHPHPDIPASSTPHNNQDRRNVPPLPLNGSPAPNKPAAGRQPSLPSQHHLESIALSGYSHPQHVSINNYLDSRLGTPHSPLRNPSDLAAHHGLPQSFPKAPSLVPTRFAQQQPQSDPVQDFFALCQNYSAMLNKAPENTDGPTAFPAVDLGPPPISPKEAALAVFDVLQQGSAYEQTPLDEFLTGAFDDSPESDMLPTPGHSPMDFGADIFQGTPLTGMMDSFDDFPPTSAFDFTSAMGKHHHMPAHPQSFDTLLTMTPESSIEPSFFNTPMTPALQNFPTYAPQPTSAPTPEPTEAAKAAATRRKSQPTGTRKNVTPESLVPIDAPIQQRKYLAPSATSRKEVPATFARKRARSQAFGDDEEEVPQGPTMSEEEAIKAKRLQNTLAARRSRKRKLEHQQLLEETIEAERSAKEQWRAHAMVLEALLRDKGYTPPPAPQI